MIKIRIKTKNKFRFIIPVPFAILHVAGSFLSSEIFWRQIVKRTNRREAQKTFSPRPADKKIVRQLFKQIIKELRYHKGLVIVDAELNDGTKIMVRL